MPRLSVVVPSYNAQALLSRALERLAQTANGAEIIVVDGGSKDGSPSIVREQFPRVKLIEQPNYGWGHATNRGIEAASGDLVLMMNSDLFLSTPALDAMEERLLSSPGVGAVGPYLLNEDGTRQRVFSALHWPRYVPMVGPISVPVVSGACMMTRRDVLSRVGLFDEGFFMYNEEYDFCGRMREHGYRAELVPFGVVHVGGGSTQPSHELVLETHRGFMYLMDKRHPGVVSEGVRRLMQLKGWFGKRFEREPAKREMWAQLESIAAREAYTESPFELSGRREVRFKRGSNGKSNGKSNGGR